MNEEERIVEIRARCEAATEGPWKAIGNWKEWLRQPAKEDSDA